MRSIPTRVELDIEGNQRAVRDAIVQMVTAGRIVMRYDYDMLGNRIHQASMEAGERWMLNDVAGKPDPRLGQPRPHFRTDYDPLRRPLRTFVTGPIRRSDAELLTAAHGLRRSSSRSAERTTCAARAVSSALRSGGRRSPAKPTTSRATCCALATAGQRIQAGDDWYAASAVSRTAPV